MEHTRRHSTEARPSSTEARTLSHEAMVLLRDERRRASSVPIPATRRRRITQMAPDVAPVLLTHCCHFPSATVGTAALVTPPIPVTAPGTPQHHIVS